MGAGSASTGGGGGGSPNQMAKDKAKAKAEKDRIENAKTKDKFGYTKPKSKFKTFVEDGGLIGSVTKPFRDKMLDVNTKFFNEKVVPAGKIKKGTTYETYMKDRLAGKTDAYGNPTPNQGSDNKASDNNSILTKSDQPNDSEPVTAPSETKTTETTETEKKYDPRKTKKKGRRKNTLTSSLGVTKLSPDYSLSNASLLGKVV